MTREQYFELKQLLKDMAKNIREAKTTYKSSQKDYSKFLLENGTYDDYSYNRNGRNSRDTDAWFRSERPVADKMRKAFSHLNSFDYRYLHVVYSLARGRKLEEIERKNKEGNELDLNNLGKYLKDYDMII